MILAPAESAMPWDLFIYKAEVDLSTHWHIGVLQGTCLSLNGFSHHRFSQDSLAFSAILRVNGIGLSMAKTIVTIAI